MDGFWTVSPGDRIRTAFLRGEIDEDEATRRLRILSWMHAILFPAGLLAGFCILRVLVHRSFYPRAIFLELAVLVIPLGPLFAWAVDRFVERPAFRRAVERRKSIP